MKMLIKDNLIKDTYHVKNKMNFLKFLVVFLQGL